jgi:predicted site-specific integrase-resolvase
MYVPERGDYLSPNQVAKILTLSPITLKNWENQGKIQAIRTQGGHRRYTRESVYKLAGYTPSQQNICYARVSSAGQKEDLNRQIQYFKLNYPNHRIISDIGSGLNFKRKGFQALLELLYQGNIKQIVVTHADRLCRFGMPLLEQLIQRNKGEIVVLNKGETSPEKELVQDLISIVTSFSGRLYGLRSHSIGKAIRRATADTQNTDTTSLPNSTGDTEKTNRNMSAALVL